MKFSTALIGVSALAPACAGAQTYPTLASGVLEYFDISDRITHGPSYDRSWGEANVRFSPQFNVVGSFINGHGMTAFDEAYVRYEWDAVSIRLGRFRPDLGFTNWSDLTYSGFNWVPLVLQYGVSGGRNVISDNAGVEAILTKGDFQLQASVVDSDLADDQVLPKNLNYATLRAQESIGPVLLGEDFLSNASGDDRMYGMDLRWTLPRIQLRSEILIGDGEESDWGYFIEGAYRVPRLDRTQLVVRTEGLTSDDYGVTRIQTLGIRQIFCQYLTANLNYGWGTGLPDDAYDQARVGWSLRTMLMVRF